MFFFASSSFLFFFLLFVGLGPFFGKRECEGEINQERKRGRDRDREDRNEKKKERKQTRNCINLQENPFPFCHIGKRIGEG